VLQVPRVPRVRRGRLVVPALLGLLGLRVALDLMVLQAPLGLLV
jgi:hypothetical protein